MDITSMIKAYYATLDSADMNKVDQFLSKDYRLLDFAPQPMDMKAMLAIQQLFKNAIPNLQHSLSNFVVIKQTVKVTMQMSGIHSADLDLRKIGGGIHPASRRFIIFNNEMLELTCVDGKIISERDISPHSPNRRLSGMLKVMGIDSTPFLDRMSMETLVLN
jgi:predicted ester cyclase